MGQGKDAGEKLAICGVCGLICCVLIIILVILGLAISKIVMGAIYIDDCPLEPMVPIWLIVGACVSLLFGGFGQQGDQEDPKLTPGKIVGFVAFLFNFAWLIAGSVWVYSIWPEVIDKDCAGSSSCCNEDLLKFAMAMTILEWFGMVFMTISVAFMIYKIVKNR